MLGHNRLSHGGKWRRLYPTDWQTIAFPRLNSITHICRKHNTMLFFLDARHRRRGAVSAWVNRTHFRPQALNEMFDVQRERRAAFHSDVGVEASGLGDPNQLNAGIAAMRDGELIDHRNSKTCLDQGTDGGAETRSDGDVVGQFMA